MSTLPELTESDVRRWVGDASFGRGQRYFRQGHILNPRRQGETLKARCLGSRAQPYHVEVTLGPDGVVAGGCSCPVGRGGCCKHAAALLLTWLHEADAFLLVEDLETALSRRSKAELVALVRKMVERYPDLEMLLELPLAGDAEAGRPVDPDVIRRQVSNAFHGVGYDWGAIYGLAQDLLELVDTGDAYAGLGDWRNAAVVYRTVARGVLDQYGMVDDEGGDLTDVVNGCVEGLGECLKATADPVQREALLRALFDVYRWDVDFGGIDMGYQVPEVILQQATAEERQRVAAWVRAALPAGDTRGDNFQRRVYGGFLLGLEADRLDDEAFLRLCREMKRWPDLVDRLLALGRVDEAIDVAHGVSDYSLLGLANLFVSHGQADLAERLVGERARTSQDTRLVEWLKRRAEEAGDLEGALVLAEALFWQRSSLAGYREVEGLAQQVERWDDLRPAILARLAGEEKHALLTQIHLEEGDVDAALEAVECIPAPPWGWRWREPLRVRVAEAAEGSRPRDAIRLYMEQVEGLIAARGRGNYVVATTYLGRVRGLYGRLGEEGTWQSLIADLRDRNRRLRALKDELRKAGL